MIGQGTEIVIDVFSLGTKVVKFSMPLDFVEEINQIYDKNLKSLKPHNDLLAGKIAEENALDEFLDDDIRDMFMWCFRQYLKISANNNWDPLLKQVWVNEMRANEYNPIHFHTSADSGVGLSSVLMLKRPDSYGVEASRAEEPANGWLSFAGGDQSPLSVSNVSVDAQVGDFFVFPYTLLHAVYPFNSTDEVRRTLAYNCDLNPKSGKKPMTGAEYFPKEDIK